MALQRFDSESVSLSPIRPKIGFYYNPEPVLILAKPGTSAKHILYVQLPGAIRQLI